MTFPYFAEEKQFFRISVYLSFLGPYHALRGGELQSV